MAYLGDFRLSDTFDFHFTTRQISGAPSTLSSTPVLSCYPANSTTELTAGITLDVDFDSRTGFNHVRIVASGANGYATATDYSVVITTGTVNSVSVVGEVIGNFSIEHRSALMPVTATRTLVVDSSGLADANMVKMGPSGSGTAQAARDIGTSVLLSNGTGTGQLKLASGYVAMTWADIAAPTTAQNLSATQISSVNNLAAGTDSINTIATSGSTVTTGSVIAGTFASTAQLDGSYWQIADSTGTLDMYLQFNVGASGVPTAGQIVAGLTSALNSLKVYAFNWAGSSWDQIGNLAGTSSIIVSTLDLDFTTAHVGTGGNLGLVRVRFANTSLTSANLYLDYAICGYTQPLTVGQIATGVWTDVTAGDFTVSASIGKSVMNGVALGTGLTINAYTGDTPQSGDAYARIGLAGVGLTNLGDTRIANLDAAVSSRMATFSLPTNFSLLAIDGSGDVTYNNAAAPSANANADALLGRNVAGGSSSGRLVSEALYVLRNKVDVPNGIVYGTDDVTQAWTFVATTAAGNPVTVVDPT